MEEEKGEKVVEELLCKKSSILSRDGVTKRKLIQRLQDYEPVILYTLRNVG